MAGPAARAGASTAGTLSRLSLPLALAAAALTFTALALAPATASAEYAESGTLSQTFGSLKSESVAVDDANGHIFVADSSSALLYNFASASDNSPIVWDGSATPAGSFGAGNVAVAADNTSGDLYVADRTHAVIDKFDRDGNLIVSFGDSAPTPDGQLSGADTPAGSFSPAGEGSFGIAVDQSNGELYAIDAGHQVIDVFDSSGAYQRQVTATPEGLYEPCGGTYADGIAVDAATGHLFVSDSCEVKAYEFDAAGSYVQILTGADTPAGSFGTGFISIAADNQSGDVYVTDTQHQVVDRLDSSGAFQDQIEGLPSGSFGGVAIDQASGEIYVADGDAGTVTIFQLVKLPEATTGAASNVQATSATVSGHLDPAGNGDITECQFEYGTPESYGETAPCSPAPLYSSPTNVTANLTGLAPNTTYHYRLIATSGGTGYGEDRTFTTQGPPLIAGETLLRIADTSASVGGEIYSGLTDTTYHVEYGAEESYGSTVPVPHVDLGSGPGFQKASLKIAGLLPEHTYHWRLVAKNRYGSAEGPDRSFTTDAPPAGDGIPRPPGAIDNRGWELVSQPDKAGNQINQALISADGDHVLYSLLSGGVPGSTSGLATLFASRNASGWVSQNALPPRIQMPFATYAPEAATPDLSQWIAAAKDGLGGNSGSPGVGLARLDDAGAQTLLHTFSTDFGPSGLSVVASDDLRHVFLASPEPIDPSQPPGTEDVYDFGGPSPLLVSAMPATGLAPACGIQAHSATMDFPGSSFNAVSEHWTSLDGSRVFFSTAGNECAGPRQLYMRDTEAGETTLITDPAKILGGDPDNGIDRFLQATPSGSEVFLRTATSYDDADDVDGSSVDMDIYRFLTATGQPTCVTCQVPNANLPGATGATSNAAISEDGSHVYFTSAVQAAGAPAPGDEQHPNLYVWRAVDRSVHFIAQIDTADSGLANWAGAGGQTTPDGNVLLFRSTGPGLDQASDSDSGGFQQYYRYDDRVASLTCVSCVAGVEPTASTPPNLVQPLPPLFPRADAMADDGHMVFFLSFDPLVPQDVNGGPDIYEWHDGAVKLITSGRTLYPSLTGPSLVGASADGRDFFFFDQAHLTSQAQDGAQKLYDARIDGGFATLTPLSACGGDACQGPPTAQPVAPAPASADFLGSGNSNRHHQRKHRRHRRHQKHHRVANHRGGRR